MGQNQSSQLNIAYDHKNMPIELYKIIQVQKNGNVLLKHKKSGDQFLLRTFTSYQEDQISGFNKLLKKRQKIQCSHLLSISQIHRKQQKNICSILQRIYLLIEYPFKNLQQEIIQRSNDKSGPRYFNESQILSILYSCCIGLKTLYKHNFTHQALALEDIMIDRTGLVKVSDPILLGKQKNYISCMKNIDIKLDEQVKKTLQSQKQKQKFFVREQQDKYYHLSPQIINFLDDFNFFYYEKEKSDVFILGCLILEACLLRKFELYNVQAKKESLSIIPLLLKQLRLRSVRKGKGYSHYSQFLIDIIAGMLNLEPKSRPNFSQIIKRIQQLNEISISLIDQLKTTGNKPRYSQNPRSHVYSAAIPQVPTSESLPLSSIPHQIQTGQRFINTSNFKIIQDGFVSHNYKNQPKITQFEVETNSKGFKGFRKPASIQRNQHQQQSFTRYQHPQSSFNNQTFHSNKLFSNSNKINESTYMQKHFNSNNQAYNSFNQSNLRYKKTSQNQAPQMVNIGSIQINFNHNNLPFHNQNIKNNNLKAQKRAFSLQKKWQFNADNRHDSQVSNIKNCSFNHQYKNVRTHREYNHIEAPKNPLYSQDIPEISALLTKINLQNHFSQLRLPQSYKNQTIFNRKSYYQQNSQYRNPLFMKTQMQSNLQKQNIEKVLQKTAGNNLFESYERSDSQHKIAANKNANEDFPYNKKASNEDSFNQKGNNSEQKQFSLTEKAKRTSSHEQLIEYDIRTPVLSIYQSNNLNKSSELIKNQPLSSGSLQMSRSNLLSQQKNYEKSQKLNSPPQLPRDKIQQNSTLKKQISLQHDGYKVSSQIQRQIDVLKQKQNVQFLKVEQCQSPTKKIRQMNEKQLQQIDIMDCQSENMRQLSSSGASISMGIRKYINPHESIKEVNEEHQGMMKSSNGGLSMTISDQFKKNKKHNQLDGSFGLQTQQIIVQEEQTFDKNRNPDTIFSQIKQGSYINIQACFKNRLEIPLSPSFSNIESQLKKTMIPPIQIQRGSRINKSSNISNISPIQQQNCNFVIESLEGGGKYQGFQIDGKNHGQGRLYFKDGGYYQGQWYENKMTGFGKLFYDSGNIAYEGFWQQDQFCGKGRVFNDRPQQFSGSFQGLDFTQLLDKWIFYEGQFQRDAKHGNGRIKLTNGEVFDGSFIYDVIEGQGCFYKIDGSILEGYWKQNIYIGKVNL